MLHETPERTIRFIHLPFQSFLAAQMALEEGHIGLLIKNAYDEEWTEILTLAAAQATAEKCEKLLRGLLHQPTQRFPPRRSDRGRREVVSRIR